MKKLYRQDLKRLRKLILRKKKNFVKKVLPVETNIIIFELNDAITGPELEARLKEKNILSYYCFNHFIHYWDIVHPNYLVAGFIFITKESIV